MHLRRVACHALPSQNTHTACHIALLSLLNPRLQAALGHDVAVYKAFNTIGTEHMHQPEGSLIGEPGVSRLRLMYAGQEGPNAQVAGSIIEEARVRPLTCVELI